MVAFAYKLFKLFQDVIYLKKSFQLIVNDVYSQYDLRVVKIFSESFHKPNVQVFFLCLRNQQACLAYWTCVGLFLSPAHFHDIVANNGTQCLVSICVVCVCAFLRNLYQFVF